jgi:hypothetical protein
MLVNATTRRDPEFNVVGGGLHYALFLFLLFTSSWSLTPLAPTVFSVVVLRRMLEDRKHSVELQECSTCDAGRRGD